METKAVTLNELVGLIVILSGLVWLIITLCLGAIKERIKNMERDIEILFEKNSKFLTIEACDKNMENCKKLREAQNESEHGKKHRV